jgi:hypothetical protein
MNANLIWPIAGILLMLSAAAGWILNIVQICSSANDPITGMFIVKCIGVLIGPLGAVLGIIGIC